MRIAQRTVSRNYKANLNRTMEKRADSLRRSEDGFRFKSLSEDVAAGARAMNTQEMRYAAIQQKNTAEELIKELDSAWGIMGSMDSTIQDVLEEMKSAAGVRTEEKLQAIQEKVHNLKEQYLQELNSQYGGKYLFGGTNNKAAPFTTNGDGYLLFNGVEVSRIHKGATVGTVGDAADDAKYANTSKYFNDGAHYYANDGNFYYNMDVVSAEVPDDYAVELTVKAPTVTPPATPPATLTAQANLSMAMGDQTIQVWDETAGAWKDLSVDFTSQATDPDEDNDPNTVGDYTVTLDRTDILGMLKDSEAGNGVRIGAEVYTLTETDGKLDFVWKGTAANEKVGPGVLDKSAPGMTEPLSGDLTINLQPTDADTIGAEPAASAFASKVSGETDDIPVPYSGSIYLDTGLGLTVGDGANVVVDPRTAFEVNVVGLELVGFTGFVGGVALDNGAYTQQSIPNNIYDAIQSVEKMLAPGYSEDQLDALQMQLTRMNDTMRMSRTDVDTRANTLENMVTRLKTEIDDMEKLEDSLMTADPANESINLKDVEYSWQAILALGSKILPSSLLDYLN